MLSDSQRALDIHGSQLSDQMAEHVRQRHALQIAPRVALHASHRQPPALCAPHSICYSAMRHANFAPATDVSQLFYSGVAADACTTRLSFLYDRLTCHYSQVSMIRSARPPPELKAGQEDGGGGLRARRALIMTD